MTSFKQAIQIIEKRLGANHPSISMYLDNLAAVPN